MTSIPLPTTPPHAPRSASPGRPTPAITIRNLSKRYDARTVVDDLSFELIAGETFAILGPNGAGKTTTVEIMEGYRAPDGGDVRVLGLDPRRDGPRLRPCIGPMLQGGGVYPQAYTLETIRHYASFYADPIAPEQLLHDLGLEGVDRTRFRRLSGGEKQRLSLALALVGRPELVFLDEPTAAMDPQARRDTWEIIRRLKAQGVTVVLTTHYIDEAAQLADRVAILRAGRLVALAPPSQVVARAGALMTLVTLQPLDTAALADHLGGVAVRDAGGGRYVVAATPAPVLVATLAAWLAERDILVLELSSGGALTRDERRDPHRGGATSPDGAGAAGDGAAADAQAW